MLSANLREFLEREAGLRDGGRKSLSPAVINRIKGKNILVYGNVKLSSQAHDELAGILRSFTDEWVLLPAEKITVARGPPELIDALKGFERRYKHTHLYSIHLRRLPHSFDCCPGSQLRFRPTKLWPVTM